MNLTGITLKVGRSVMTLASSGYGEPAGLLKGDLELAARFVACILRQVTDCGNGSLREVTGFVG